jgi:hypothetical protein
MTERITSRLNKSIGDKSKSLKTVVPQIVVQRMQLSEFEMLEWIESRREKQVNFIVKKL